MRQMDGSGLIMIPEHFKILMYNLELSVVHFVDEQQYINLPIETTPCSKKPSPQTLAVTLSNLNRF